MSLNALLQQRAALAVPPVPPGNQPQGTGKTLTDQGGSPGSLSSPENNEEVEGAGQERDAGNLPQNEYEHQRRTIHFHESEGTGEPEPLLAPSSNTETHHRLWLVTPADGARFSLSRNPPGTLAEIRRDYPKCSVTMETEPQP